MINQPGTFFLVNPFCEIMKPVIYFLFAFTVILHEAQAYGNSRRTGFLPAPGKRNIVLSGLSVIDSVPVLRDFSEDSIVEDTLVEPPGPENFDVNSYYSYNYEPIEPQLMKAEEALMQMNSNFENERQPRKNRPRPICQGNVFSKLHLLLLLFHFYLLLQQAVTVVWLL